MSIHLYQPSRKTQTQGHCVVARSAEMPSVENVRASAESRETVWHRSLAYTVLVCGQLHCYFTRKQTAKNTETQCQRSVQFARPMSAASQLSPIRRHNC